jgi:hypothetical protein
MAEQWEWLADTANGSWLLPSKSREDRCECPLGLNVARGAQTLNSR